MSNVEKATVFGVLPYTDLPKSTHQTFLLTLTDIMPLSSRSGCMVRGYIDDGSLIDFYAIDPIVSEFMYKAYSAASRAINSSRPRKEDHEILIGVLRDPDFSQLLIVFAELRGTGWKQPNDKREPAGKETERYHITRVSEDMPPIVVPINVCSIEEAKQWVVSNQKPADLTSHYFKVIRATRYDKDGKYIGGAVEYLDRSGNKVELFDVWQVNTEKGEAFKWEDTLMRANVAEEAAVEIIHHEHADEPSPDRDEYWNCVMVPSGIKPYKHQRM